MQKFRPQSKGKSTGSSTPSNDFVTSSQVVVVGMKSPRTSYSDEVLSSSVSLANVVSGAVDSGVERHQN